MFSIVALTGSVAFLIWRNYQLEKRWRAIRYCWQCMSDMAGARLKSDEGDDDQWKQTVFEHKRFAAKFGAELPLGNHALSDYELELTERGYDVLVEHQA